MLASWISRSIHLIALLDSATALVISNNSTLSSAPATLGNGRNSTGINTSVLSRVSSHPASVTPLIDIRTVYVTLTSTLTTTAYTANNQCVCTVAGLTSVANTGVSTNSNVNGNAAGGINNAVSSSGDVSRNGNSGPSSDNAVLNGNVVPGGAVLISQQSFQGTTTIVYVYSTAVTSSSTRYSYTTSTIYAEAVGSTRTTTVTMTDVIPFTFTNSITSTVTVTSTSDISQTAQNVQSSQVRYSNTSSTVMIPVIQTMLMPVSSDEAVAFSTFASASTSDLPESTGGAGIGGVSSSSPASPSLSFSSTVTVVALSSTTEVPITQSSMSRLGQSLDFSGLTTSISSALTSISSLMGESSLELSLPPLSASTTMDTIYAYTSSSAGDSSIFISSTSTSMPSSVTSAFTTTSNDLTTPTSSSSSFQASITLNMDSSSFSSEQYTTTSSDPETSTSSSSSFEASTTFEMDASSSSTSTLSSTESVTASTTSAFVLTYTSSSTSSSASQPVATCIEPGTSDYYIHATAIDGIKFLNYQYTQGFFTSFSTGSADPRLIVRPANFDPVTCRFSLYMLNQPSYSNAQYLGFITDYDNVDNKNDMLANSYNHVQLGGSNTNAGSAQGFAYQNSRNMADEGPGLTSESGVWSLVDSATNTLQVNWINVSGEIVTLPTYKNEYGDVKGIRDISTYSAHYTSETNIAILFSLVRVQ